MDAEAPYLGVARFQKPHGLQGEAVVFVLTDTPADVFVPGRRLVPVDEAGRACGEPIAIERARPYHRRWLVKFAGLETREALDGLRGTLLGVAREALTPPADGEMYYHEIPGCRVLVDGRAAGIARDVARVPGGELLVVDVDGREVLIPLRKPILVRLDRTRREIEVDPPAGLLEL